MLLQLSAGVGDDAMLAIRVDLSEDGPKATWLFVVPEAGIHNEGIGPVASRVVDNWLGAEVGLKFEEGLKSVRGKCAPFPGALFFRQSCEWRCKLGKVAHVPPKKVA
jgi:hypothetical protein